MSISTAAVRLSPPEPARYPAGELIIFRDGDPGEPEQALGGFGSVYYQHAVEIEVYLEEGDAAVRDAAFDDLLQQIGTVLDADPALGGLAFDLPMAGPRRRSGRRPARRRSRARR